MERAPAGGGAGGGVMGRSKARSSAAHVDCQHKARCPGIETRGATRVSCCIFGELDLITLRGGGDGAAPA